MASTKSQVTEFGVSERGPGTQKGLKIGRYFSRPGVDPYDEIEWEQRASSITNEKGKVVFEQNNVEIPKAWSLMATNVVVSKYFRGPLASPQREHSVRQMIGRVVDTITGWGRAKLPWRAHPHSCAPEGLLQQPGMVQLRYRSQAPMLRLFYSRGGRHHGIDPGLVPQGRNYL